MPTPNCFSRNCSSANPNFQLITTSRRAPSGLETCQYSTYFLEGNKSLTSNYRPISLTSICCKIMERLIHTHLYQNLELLNILCDQQHGFCPRRSCESQLITTINNISKLLDSGLQTDIFLLDLSKSFDKVPHHRLCNKLYYYGIRGKLLVWIENFLIGRQQQVILDGSYSDSHTLDSGVPQGTILAPLLFYVILMI